MVKIKKTPCKKCGGTEFKQKYHAIIDDFGYIDADGNFVSESHNIDEVTNGVEVFKCIRCDTEVEVKEDDEEDSDG